MTSLRVAFLIDASSPRSVLVSANDFNEPNTAVNIFICNACLQAAFDLLVACFWIQSEKCNSICNRCLFGTFGYIRPYSWIAASITATPNGNADKQPVEFELAACIDDEDENEYVKKVDDEYILIPDVRWLIPVFEWLHTPVVLVDNKAELTVDEPADELADEPAPRPIIADDE